MSKVLRIRLSTSLTFIWKYLYTGFFILSFGLGTILAIMEGGDVALIMVILFTGITYFLYFRLGRAKKVFMDSEYLYISNFFKEIKVPLKEISDVKDDSWSQLRPIVVHFKEETEFGDRIMFLGRMEAFLFFSDHPAANKLRSAIKTWIDDLSDASGLKRLWSGARSES